MVETAVGTQDLMKIGTFSILERIVVVETSIFFTDRYFSLTFSILERIVVVETNGTGKTSVLDAILSVSSNGSWWLKPARTALIPLANDSFSILERIVVVET